MTDEATWITDQAYVLFTLPHRDRVVRVDCTGPGSWKIHCELHVVEFRLIQRLSESRRTLDHPSANGVDYINASVPTNNEDDTKVSPRVITPEDR